MHKSNDNDNEKGGDESNIWAARGIWYRRIEGCSSRTNGQATSLCCRRRWAGVVDAGFASTTDWKKDFLRTTDYRCKEGGLVGAPVDVRVADNASARAERSEAVARHEKEEEQAKSRHHGLVDKGCYAEPGRRKATVERREPGLQVGNVHRWVTQRRRKGRDSDVSSEQQIEGPK